VSPPARDLPAAEYDAELARGLRLTGETREHFSRRRVAFLRARLDRRGAPGVRSILDFGCGTGETSLHLAEAFPEAAVTSVDAATEMVHEARRRFPQSNVRFEESGWLDSEGRSFDLIYAANVLHHAPPQDRGAIIASLAARLAPAGVLAVFENNPWNPGTRAVMARIPFDDGVAPLSPRELAQRLAHAGLRLVEQRTLFYFPRWLQWLRPLEPPLGLLPLGGQTYALAQRPEVS
jgi:trans-aconitate methyltransferase